MADKKVEVYIKGKYSNSIWVPNSFPDQVAIQEAKKRNQQLTFPVSESVLSFKVVSVPVTKS